MSLDVLVRVVERASADPAFRAELASNPERALAGYALTVEDRAAMLGHGLAPLRPLGVEARIAKLTTSDTTIPTGDSFFGA
jgi:hypothetical protein